MPDIFKNHIARSAQVSDDESQQILAIYDKKNEKKLKPAAGSIARPAPLFCP